MLLLLNGLWALVTLTFLFPIARTYIHRRQLEPVSADETITWPPVSLIIPVRDEARNIATALEAITRLDYPQEQLEVLVVNDRSRDETAAIVERFAAENNHIRLLDAPPLAEGWTGKANGCQHGAEAAGGEWLIFLDADTYVKPALVASAISYAREHDSDLLSLIPFQIIASFEERISLPGIFLGFASVIDFRRVNDPADSQAVANGQFLLFSRRGYQKVGGHRAIRGELSDDLAFARRAKEGGLNVQCLFADRLVETRMYRSLAEVWSGFARNAVDIMRASALLPLLLRSLRSLLIGVGMVLLPPLTLCGAGGGGGTAVFVMLATLLSLGVTFAVALWTLRVPLYYLLAAPIGLVLHGLVLIHSYLQLKRGIRAWKGRSYSS